MVVQREVKLTHQKFFLHKTGSGYGLEMGRHLENSRGAWKGNISSIHRGRRCCSSLFFQLHLPYSFDVTDVWAATLCLCDWPPAWTAVSHPLINFLVVEDRGCHPHVSAWSFKLYVGWVINVCLLIFPRVSSSLFLPPPRTHYRAHWGNFNLNETQ